MRLAEVVKELSSKNAGNFHLCFDIVFESATEYRRVRDGQFISPASVSALYGIPIDDIAVINFDPGLAIKVTLRRPRPSGDPGETDVYGAQQYPPLLDLDVGM